MCNVDRELQIFSHHAVTCDLRSFADNRASRHAVNRRVVAFVHLSRFGKIKVFAVRNIHHIESRGVFHDSFEQIGVLDRSAVIADCYRAAFCKFADRSKRFAFETFRSCSYRIKFDAVSFRSAFIHIADGFYVVSSRFCVRHRADRGESACRSSFETRNDVFFIFESGISEVNVNINEAGSNEKTVCIEDFGTFRVWVLGDFGNNTVFYNY